MANFWSQGIVGVKNRNNILENGMILQEEGVCRDC
jgi:hypothetical protein